MSRDCYSLFLCFIVSFKMANIKTCAYAKERTRTVREKLMLRERGNNCRSKDLED